MYAITALKIKKKKRQSQTIIIKIIIQTFKRPNEVHCLLDSGAERNFISQAWVKKHDLSENQFFLEQIQAIDGGKVICYKRHIFNFITLTDFNSTFKDGKVSAHVIDMGKYDFILNYPWLCEANPNIDGKNHNFIYHTESNKNTVKFDIELCDVEKFTQLAMLAIKKNHEAYIAFSGKLIFSIFDMINDNAVRCEAMQNESIEIFKQLKNLSKIFGKNYFIS